MVNPTLSHRWAALILVTVLLIAAAIPTALAQSLHIYNWNDYFAEDTLANFQARTGIRPVLDLYNANEVLEAKLFAGRSGYDVVFPTMRPFAARHIQAGLYRPLDKDRLPGLDRLDPTIMASLASADPGNAHAVPYMWGTTGLGLNPAKVREILGEDAPLDTWGLIFDPANAERLAGCGISLLDDPAEVIPAALIYLGRDPHSLAHEDLAAVRGLLDAIHPFLRNIHSSQYISDLANGELCVAHGYSGDVLQAQTRAEEAGGRVEIDYLIPREGAVLWTDVIAIPKDAPNPDAAHAFIAYLLEPEVIAAISNYVFYANPNPASKPYLDPALRDDPGIYPPAEVQARLVVPALRSERELRELNRFWTRAKAQR